MKKLFTLIFCVLICLTGSATSPDTTICICKENTPYVFDQATFGYRYKWTSEGTYQVRYPRPPQPDSIVDVKFTFYPNTKVEISADPDYCETFTTNLIAKCVKPGTNEEITVLQYNWDNGETSPTIFTDIPGKYIVSVVNKYGCVVTDSFKIDCPKPMPNAFSPSIKDGYNDYFSIPWKPLIKELLEFTVYNRYGTKIYHTTNKDFEWNGTENGKLHIGATYFYILRYVPYEGKIPDPITGLITIF